MLNSQVYILNGRFAHNTCTSWFNPFMPMVPF